MCRKLKSSRTRGRENVTDRREIEKGSSVRRFLSGLSTNDSLDTNLDVPRMTLEAQMRQGSHCSGRLREYD
jgi:hypothetical protein